MGLIKAGLAAVGTVLADQWKEFFYCDSLDDTVMVVKGQKRVSGKSSNHGSDNIISNGSGIAVADGQCMIIVEQGKVVELCAEPGQFTYDTSSEPSIFTGKLGESIKETFKAIGRRFAYGGDTGKDQRVYYFNTKELLDNKFGTANPIPFRVVDRRIGLDYDVSLRCSGVYSYRIADPILFYTKVCGNVEESYMRAKLEPQMKTEFISALQPAFARLSAMELRPNEILLHNQELEDLMKEELSGEWGQLRGLEIVNVALGSVTLPEEDQQMIKQAQQAAVLSNANLAAGYMTGATGTAMNTAAANTAGAMTGFMGMGMANNAGANAAATMFQVGQQQTAPQFNPAPAVPAAPAAGSWICPTCGKPATGKFCAECGTPKPAPVGSWVCPTCGKTATGKFCAECGTKKPEAAPTVCKNCGYQIAPGEAAPKFCPECGKPFA